MPEEINVPEFDLVVLGGGPGGYAAALYGASAGMHIAIVEEQRLGGTCLNRGCIPAKELLQTAEVLRTVRGAAEFGVHTPSPTIDLTETQVRKQAVVDRLVGGLETLLKGRKVTVGGKDVELTAREFDLLRHFLLHPDLVLTREQLMQAVWGIDYFGTPRTVDNFILRLREKLEDDPTQPRFETVRGVGYRFNGG